MATADDVMLEMLRGLKNDVVTIRDNHLAHIAVDIKDIQAEQIAQRRDIDELMVFKEDLTDCIKAGFNKLIIAIATIVATALGIPAIL
tara:strand:+ start:22 stop:285 length:264 start_codon:yes stop_codon:yes gene_type:complete